MDKDYKNKSTTEKFEIRNTIYKNIEKEYGIKPMSNIGDFIDTLKFNFIVKNDLNESSDEENLINQVFGAQSLAGLTDYKDHRNDSAEELIKIAKEKIYNDKSMAGSRFLQFLYFINLETGELYKDILITGYNGGWKASFLK